MGRGKEQKEEEGISRQMDVLFGRHLRQFDSSYPFPFLMVWSENQVVALVHLAKEWDQNITSPAFLVG